MDTLKRYYCQPDGGQWNVEVEVLDFDVKHGYSVIRGKNLIGTYLNDTGLNYLVVDSRCLWDKVQS